MLFAVCDRRSPIKNFTDRLNIRELQVDDISPKCTAESTKKYTIQVNKVLNRCFLVDCQLHMSSVVFYTIIWCIAS